ncbi:putative flippase GtrA [Microbacterium sp. SORGH_AS 505]|uniref:Pr6Pr family membrane protein n=1 Tax=Microbacterium sp. SORGH_AS_0505 TaxID=3041770 RepID=UPI002784F089|nr:Pr6Pr family membrane protein [Microbacterium sp. SORGH_AS_0505]MDQ1127182.1 putative flippase GtrA [Microbacterium sp. SORGH_AS_0505]
MPPSRIPRSVVAIGGVRVGMAVGVLVALGWTYARSVQRGSVNPFDFFGYFTNQTALGSAIVLGATGILLLLDRIVPAWLTLARGVAVACLIVVGVVYNGFVPGTGSAPPWVSAVLHIALPLYTVLDWAFVRDHPSLPWRSLWLVLPYPLLWLVVVLVRGQTDGWVPYGFLLPSRGFGALVLTSLGLLAMLLAAAAAVWALSRLRVATTADRR